MKPLIFLNLSNGVVYPGPFDGLVRIQSTWCEQKLWSRIIEDLDYSLLIPLALGRKCIVVDVSAKKVESRAIYQGLPWIKYVIDQRLNPLPTTTAVVKGQDTTKYFQEQFAHLSHEAARKLDYVNSFGVWPHETRLEGLSIVADIDGKQDQITSRLRELYSIGD